MPRVLSKTPYVALGLTLAVIVGAVAFDRLSPGTPAAAPAPRAAIATTPTRSIAALAPQSQPPAPSAAAPAPAPAPPQRMPPALEAAFDQWLVGAYLKCWSPPPQSAEDEPYIAQVRLVYARDGSLSASPKLVNPPSNPAWKPQAKSVMKAVQACNPLSVPAQYAPYYDHWKTKTIHFDPETTRG